MYMNRTGVVFGYKDSYDIPTTLNPIIAGAVKNFRDVIQKKYSEDFPCVGIPQRLLNELAGIDSESGIVGDSHLLSSADLFGETTAAAKADYDAEFDTKFKKWIEVLDKIIYAFSAPEPTIPDNLYGPLISSPAFDDDGKEMQGFTTVDFNCIDTEGRDAYGKLVDEHRVKVTEGIELFAKYYNDLWW